MKSELAEARDKWLESDEGKKCGNPQSLCSSNFRPSTKQYLQNRLKVAFIAGWNACGKACKEALEDKP